jgi:hypothetical protein
MADELVLCYNKGCGHKFNPKENKEDSCRYHPGGPIFHDALKGWSCCKKRSTDFSEFLSIPGCTRGCHSNVKPPEPEKQARANGDDSNESQSQGEIIIKPVQPTVRPSDSEPTVRLPVTVADSLKQALEKQMKDLNINVAKDSEDVTEVVQKGTSCKNNSCTAIYEGEESNKERCCYHPGVPVFHEGMKFWSCCERKTTDFNTFLSQAGCADGKHLWKKTETEGEKKVACRYDWHQTGSAVTVSVFAKLAQPLKTWVEANKVTLRINIVFDGGKSQFEKFFVLNEAIDPEKSSVKMLGTKVEINMKKLEPGSWRSLELATPNS